MTAQECRNMFCKNEKCCFLFANCIVCKSFTYPNCFKIVIHVRTKLNVFGTQKSCNPFFGGKEYLFWVTNYWESTEGRKPKLKHYLRTFPLSYLQVISVESEYGYLQWSVKANNYELLNTKMNATKFGSFG